MPIRGWPSDVVWRGVVSALSSAAVRDPLAFAQSCKPLLAAVAMLATLASCCGRAFTILCEVAGVMWRAAAAVAALAAFASRFDRTRPILGEIAGTLLPSDMSRARRLLAIEREIAAICNGSRFRHGVLPILTPSQKPSPRARVALRPGNPDDRGFPDHHLGTRVSDVKIGEAQMARSTGYERVVRDASPQ